jgi:hypothetical protein
VDVASRIPLSYNASTSSTRDLDARDYRYERRAQARQISHLDRVRKCGRTPIGSVVIGRKGEHAAQRGLFTCGSIWACPVCSAKILTYRFHEISKALKTWESKGGSFIFQTLTLSHQLGDSVAKQRSLLTIGWNAITKGSFSKANSENGQIGYFKVLEPSFGENGPHLHLHIVRFLEREMPAPDAKAWMERVANRWIEAIAKSGGRKASMVAQHYKQMSSASQLVGYFTKNFDNAAYGLDWARTNTSSSFPAWGLLSKALAHPNTSFRRAWNAFERESKNMRQITWSRELRQILGMGNEIDDKDISADNPQFVPVIQISRNSVRTFGNLGRLHSVILRHVERGDVSLAEQVLTEHGIEFVRLEQSRKVDLGLP